MAHQPPWSDFPFVVLTEPFAEQMRRTMAYQPADRALSPVVIQHPMQNIGPEELRGRARQLADAAERLLGGASNR